MTELQKVELAILKEVLRICDELNIKYYLVCGSALGAVKYQGFIPWDDDMDIGMLRDDYEVFIQKAPKMLPEYYFLQNYHTDKNFPLFMSKIRDTRTTFVEKLFKNIDMHHGVYIDIFPLDGYPKNSTAIRNLEKQKKVSSRLRSVRYYYENNKISSVGLRTSIYRALFKLFGMYSNTSKAIRAFDRLAASYKIENSDYICNHGNWQGQLEYAPKWHYGDGTWATFEGLKVRIPENYDAYLTQKYDDWMADLPEEKRNSGHSIVKIDLTMPYTQIIRKMMNGKIQID